MTVTSIRHWRLLRTTGVNLQHVFQVVGVHRVTVINRQEAPVY